MPSVYKRYTIEREMDEKRAAVEEERKDLEERKTILQEKVDYLHDESGIEAEIRKHFDVAKDGEQVVVLIDKNRPDNEVGVSTTTDDKSENSLWSKLIPW